MAEVCGGHSEDAEEAKALIRPGPVRKASWRMVPWSEHLAVARRGGSFLAGRWQRHKPKQPGRPGKLNFNRASGGRLRMVGPGMEGLMPHRKKLGFYPMWWAVSEELSDMSY